MNKQEIIFYEDTKKQKRNLKIYSLVFYSGAVIWTFLMVVFSLISKKIDLDLSPPFAIWFLAFAIFGTILASRKKFKYFIAISETEFIFKYEVQGKNKWDTSDLKNYAFVKNCRGKIAEYKLFFSETAILIRTKKAQELRDVLDYLISKNNDEQ